MPQYLVRVAIKGDSTHPAPEMMVSLYNVETKQYTFIPVHKISEPPYSLRIIQIFRHDPAGWVALVEPLANT